MTQTERTPLRRLKVGVVGLGRMGRRHAINILHSTPRATLLCACSPAEPDLVWAATELEPHGVTVVPTFEEMIQTPGLEAVIIASATPLHKEQTVAALEKGIHVLCEKPVCTSLEELESLSAKVKAMPTSATLMVAFVRRFDRDYMDARSRIVEGAIDEPIVIRAQGCERLDLSNAYKDYLAASGGIFLDTAIHDIDLSLYLFGDSERPCVPKSVSAIGTAAHHTQLPAIGDSDNAIGVVEYWDGRMFYSYHARTSAHGYDNTTEIFGKSGKLSINIHPRMNAVEVCDKDGFVKTPAHPNWYERYAPAFVTEANQWVDAVLEGKPMPVPFESALTSLTIATALQESLVSGKKIYFDREGKRLKDGPLLN